MAYTYETLKELAAERGGSVKDLIALAPNNDPFYVGQPAQRLAAEWFIALWPRFGAERRYLRGMHYQMVTQGEPIPLPVTLNWTDKETGAKESTGVYLNNIPCWQYLENASKFARYLGLLGPDELRDRRNRDPYIFAPWSSEDVTEPDVYVTGNEEPELSAYSMPLVPELRELPGRLPTLPRLASDGYSVSQPYHVEVWIEKAAMDDELIPICRKYGVNLVVGAGELSIPAVRKLLTRAAESQKPVRILYISDFDPAGLGMPVSVARKIEFYHRNQTDLSEFDIALHPIVLTAEQVKEYHLPRIPVKDGDRRKGNFELVYGEGQVELDALTALRPGVFERIVETAILRYYDTELNDRVSEAARELNDAVAGATWTVNEMRSNDWELLEAEYAALRQDFEATRQDFARLVAPFQTQIDAYKDRLEDLKERIRGAYGVVYEAMEQAADDFPTWEYAAPDPETTGDYYGMLYSSDRSYFDQLAMYKVRKHGHNGNGHNGEIGDVNSDSHNSFEAQT